MDQMCSDTACQNTLGGISEHPGLTKKCVLMQWSLHKPKFSFHLCLPPHTRPRPTKPWCGVASVNLWSFVLIFAQAMIYCLPPHARPRPTHPWCRVASGIFWSFALILAQAKVFLWSFTCLLTHKFCSDWVIHSSQKTDSEWDVKHSISPVLSGLFRAATNRFWGGCSEKHKSCFEQVM